MPSPFPGMDPYLEGYLWADVHNALANKIRQQLAPKIQPGYTVRLEVYLVQDTAPESEIGILYPDVEVLRQKSAPLTAKSSSLPIEHGGILLTPAPLILPLMPPIEVRIPTVEIRDTASNTLVTSIEILSPVNKREPGITPYRQKRQRLYRANVHLIEIDLLRRGTRPFVHPRLPSVPYLVTLTRAQAQEIEVWPIALSDLLPVIPVPLRSPDADVPLDLASALRDIYHEAFYNLSIDYREPPPKPALSEEEQAWVDALLMPLRTKA
ncbi:DUF4058 family protein [Leptolyngbya sp. FACHB-671]|uniref:DUF4058 family protein n=1 Tax=Leptolyngbya sp. FACHB-671 TaxID=2692812 RepID=UPI001687031D|nr:DUF4058 family protein [Leptolyngbya sp. FACHB-671]MBD2068936.1 DUF4058 family protein [Leptolyngbya sp. FACHB-671]